MVKVLDGADGGGVFLVAAGRLLGEGLGQLLWSLPNTMGAKLTACRVSSSSAGPS